MSQSCFRILNLLLVFWQLLLPFSAPWLHSCLDGCALSAGVASECETPNLTSGSSEEKHKCACCHHGDPPPCGQQESDHREPHDCSSCALCQAISAPRMLVAAVSVQGSCEIIETLRAEECLDPLLGFGLPPRSRAPPADFI